MRQAVAEWTYIEAVQVRDAMQESVLASGRALEIGCLLAMCFLGSYLLVRLVTAVFGPRGR